MRLHDLINYGYGYDPYDGMTKLSAEERYGIIKRAGEILDERFQAINFAEDIAKVAAEEIDQMDFSDPELQKVASELLAYGAGMADGEIMTKQALYPAIYNEAYNVFIQKIAEAAGPEAAAEVDDILRQEGGEEQAAADEIDDIIDDVTEEVASAMVEQAGGIEEVQQDPELSQDILEHASEVAEQIVEEHLAGE